MLEQREIFSKRHFSAFLVFLILEMSFLAPSGYDHLMLMGIVALGETWTLLFVIVNYTDYFKTYVNRLLSKQILF